jgi:FkbM family methyltransferase
LEKELLTKKIFVVIGANFGYHAIQQSKNNPKLKVIAVEPHPGTFKLLEQNCKLNFVEIELRNVAISEVEGNVNLYESDFNGGNNRLEPFENSQIVNSVTAISIEKFLQEMQDNPDIFLIDMQGNELETVIGIFNLQKNKTICIFELDMGSKANNQIYISDLASKIRDDIQFSILDRRGNLLIQSREDFIVEINNSLNQDLVIVAQN